MKRLRHYNKELAVVLSVFGSSDEEAIKQYIELEEYLKTELQHETKVEIAISSRMVLKNLEKQGLTGFTLTQQLANLDRLGYKKIAVASINVFPTSEHEYLLNIVNSFKNISPARYEVTTPLFSRSKKTSSYLKSLNDKLREQYPHPNILYIAHGAPDLDSKGNQIFSYVRDYLKLLNPKNFFYTLEGGFEYDKELFLQEYDRENSITPTSKEVLVVPLLLVKGGHVKDDIYEICEELNSLEIKASMPENFNHKGDFSLLKYNETTKYFKDELEEAVKKLNWI